jgi:transcriptional regulator GlxA family with amidase domain
MAAASEISVTTLRRLFVSVLNKKPIEVMTGIQMEVATRLLETTNLKYESVAAQTGFTSPRSFARFFAAQVGCSPYRWRLKVRTIVREAEDWTSTH